MFRENSKNGQQIQFNDPFLNFSPEKKEKAKNSWAYEFKQNILPNINESRFKVLYSDKASRPNAPINVMIGALLIKEIFHLNDETLVENIEFNSLYQYALGLSEPNCPFSTRTITRFRRKLFEYEFETGIDLVHETIKDLFNSLAGLMNINESKQRMDSFQVASNIRNLTRLEIIYETVLKVVKELDKQSIRIPKRLKHYLRKEDHNQIFYYDKKTSYEIKTSRLIQDTLLAQKLATEYLKKTPALELINRLVSEQFIKDGKNVRLKKDKSEGLSSQTLQSPYDPDATYRKKGKSQIGYVANVVESGDSGQTMFTDYQFEKNTYSDSQFLKDKIQNEPDHKDNPITLVTDGAYASTENEILAKEKGIDLVTTDLVGKKPDLFHADFKFDEKDKMIIECPNGCKPEKTSFYEELQTCRAVFKKEDCNNCPYKDQCKPNEQLKSFSKIVSFKSKVRAQTHKKYESSEFKEQRDYRNGIETVPSNLRNFCNLDKMPVRGLIRTGQWFGFKLAGAAFKKFKRFLDKFKPKDQYVLNYV